MAFFTKKKPAIWRPTFRIRMARIVNIGVIDDLTLNFESEGCTCIYAGNGVGKTTILESLSLLGHLPCFPTFDEAGGFKNSRLSQLLGSGPTSICHYGEEFKLEKLAILGPEKWMQSILPAYNSNFGVVKFEIEDTVQFQQCLNTFYVLIHGRKLTGDRQPKLTGILSRGDFDQYRESEISRNAPTDDLDLSDFGLIVSHSNSQSCQTIPELIDKIALGRTFLTTTGSQILNRSFEELILRSRPGLEPRSVSYINTDLNDFGRGNDLRESPKDLEADFGQEMFDRHRVQKTGEGVLGNIEELSRICNFILNAPHTEGSTELIVWPSFELRNARDLNGKLSLLVNRKDGLPPVSITFLSAGENEVFFVLLVLLNLTTNPKLGRSIALLDEPDLHVALGIRSRFFTKIFEVSAGLSGKNATPLQLIACSHSPSFFDTLISQYRKAQKSCAVVARKMVSIPDRNATSAPRTVLTAFYDELYLRNMGGRNYFQSRSRAFLFSLRTKILHQYCRTRDALPPFYQDFSALLTIASLIIFFLGSSYFLIGKLINDYAESIPERRANWLVQFFLRGKSETEYHPFSNDWLSGFALSFITFLLFILIRRLIKHNRRKSALSRFRELVS